MNHETLASEAVQTQKLSRHLGNELGEIFPGLESKPGVCGGDPCIVRTRIPIWVLEQARRLGTSDADLLRSYPTIRAEDLAQAWAYAAIHSDDINAAIRLNEAA